MDQHTPIEALCERMALAFAALVQADIMAAGGVS